MSLVSATKIEVEVEQSGTFNTFINDINNLIWFVRRYNNTFPEYIRVARMYLFGTPIRRTGAGFRRATPGCVRPSCAAPSLVIASETTAKHPHSTRHAGASGSSCSRVGRRTAATQSLTTRSIFPFRRTATSTFTRSNSGGVSEPAWCVFPCH